MWKEFFEVLVFHKILNEFLDFMKLLSTGLFEVSLFSTPGRSFPSLFHKRGAAGKGNNTGKRVVFQHFHGYYYYY